MCNWARGLICRFSSANKLLIIYNGILIQAVIAVSQEA